jgi:hypothetical protein
MTARGAPPGRLLEAEAAAWRDLPPAEYDLAVCQVLREVTAPAPSAEAVEAVLGVCSASLRRDGPALLDSRACCAERLLALIPATSEPALHTRVRLLVLLAWLRLAAVAARGPDSVSVGPSLPAGVVLPAGADPAAISDTALRAQARQLVERHRQAVEAWNARQRALDHLRRLASLLRTASSDFRDDQEAARDLAAAMSAAPGVSPELRRLLEQDVG